MINCQGLAIATLSPSDRYHYRYRYLSLYPARWGHSEMEGVGKGAKK